MAPQQVPRKDNCSIELKLVSSKIRNAGPDSTLNKMKPEQLYGETKYRFFTLMRSIPSDAELSDVDVRSMLGQLASWAAMNQHMEILDEISSIVAACKKLVSLGALREEDNYGRLRKDLAEEVTNIASKTKRVATDLERAQGSSSKRSRTAMNLVFNNSECTRSISQMFAPQLRQPLASLAKNPKPKPEVRSNSHIPSWRRMES